MAETTLLEQQQTVTHDTFVLRRTYQASPERVFAAISDPAQKKRWFAGGEHHDTEEFTMDFRVGGREWALYRFKPDSPFPGVVFSNETIFQDIIPLQRVVWVSVMAFAGKRISATQVTLELVPEGKGTLLVCTHQGAFFPGADGPEREQEGFRTILDRLRAVLEESA